VLGHNSLSFQGILVVPGVVDSDYTEEIKILISPPTKTVQIDKGQRIAQLLLLPYYQTGKTMTEHNKASKLIPSPYDAKMYALTSEREIIYDRINKRVDVMVECGLFSEVENLLKSGITKDMQSMQGIGYKEIVSYFENEITKDEAIEAVKQNSRRYAKRQLTWFNRDERYKWLDISKGIDIENLV